MSEYAIGLMSGTSGDGISVALGQFGPRQYRLIDYKTFPYPVSVHKNILNAHRLSVSEIALLNYQLGHIFTYC